MISTIKSGPKNDISWQGMCVGVSIVRGWGGDQISIINSEVKKHRYLLGINVFVCAIAIPRNL